MSLLLQPDGRVLAGLDRLTFPDIGPALVRLNGDGSLDASFHLGVGISAATDVGNVSALALQPDGKILVGGAFDTYDGEARPNLVRLNADGSLDPMFVVPWGYEDLGQAAWEIGEVRALALQPDGQILIGGWFKSIAGLPRWGVARLLGDAGTNAPCAAAPPGLVGWWRAEGNASDTVGGNTGGLSNNVGFAAGKVGQAFVFDGGGYVEVPDAPALRLEHELTIEFWVRRERLDQPHYIVEKGGDWTRGEQNYAVALHTGAYNHCLHFLFAGGWRGGGSIADTNWHHCAAVARDVDTDPALYIDGVAQAIVYGEGAETIRLNPSTRPLHIGAQIDPQSGWFYYHEGMLDELSIYNRALSAQEIQAVYRANGYGKCVIGAPPAFVERRIGTPTIQLIATPQPSVSVYAVEDRPPANWVMRNISAGGVFDPRTGKVKFGPFYDATPRTLTYDVFPPPDAQGVFTFTGQASADGVNMPIGGDQHFVIAGFHPAEVRQTQPADWRMSIEEMTAYASAWRRGLHWIVPPHVIPIDYVTRAAFLWRGGECYEVDPAVTNAPLWWVNCDSERSADFQSAGSRVSNLPAGQRQMPPAYIPGEPERRAIWRTTMVSSGSILMANAILRSRLKCIRVMSRPGASRLCRMESCWSTEISA